MRLSISRLVRNFQTWWSAYPLCSERFWGWARLLFLIFSLLGFVLIRITVFEGVTPLTIVDQMEQKLPFLHIFPSWLVMFLVPLTTWHYFRYLLKPLTLFLMLLVIGALYVRDIYHIRKFWPVFKHVSSSMFGLAYPRLTIDGGEMKIPEGQVNTLSEIGGPGFALIQPGNAVIFRHLRGPSRIILSRSYFLKPFETFGQIANLDDQHDSL